MTEYTRIYDRFKYHMEDLGCSVCLHYKAKRKAHKNGCRKETCQYYGIWHEATENGRIGSARGWFKCMEG